MGCIVSSVACCFCSAAASLCCHCLPSCKSSTSSRMMFSLILILATILSAIALIPGMRTALAKIPALCTPFTLGGVLPNGVQSGLNCEQITGFGAVYRICFATTIFFFMFSIFMIRVRSSRDPRSKIQNGFWFFKFIIWILLIVAAFFIPVEGFTYTWMVIGMCGGFLYILIQLILLVDFAHSWNESWVAALENTGEKCYAVGLVAATVFFYIVSFIGIGLLFHFYANETVCGLNKAMLSVNLILCVIVTVISMLPQVRERVPTSGILQSSIVTCYVTYLTWSSLSNSQNPLCNPALPQNISSTDPIIPITSTVNWQTVFGLLFLMFSVAYSSVRSSSHTAMGKLTVSGVESVSLNDRITAPPTTDSDSRKQVVWDDEEDGVTYVYSMLHFMLMLATLYVMVTLTNWLEPANDLKSLTANAASYWVRMASTWVCLALYTWTMIAPILFPDREF